MEKKVYWRGVQGVTMIWHGEWDAPELENEGNVANYWDVENEMWESYKSECRSADFYHFREDDDLEFNRFCQDYAEEVYELIEVYSKEQ